MRSRNRLQRFNPLFGAWQYLGIFREHVGRRLYIVFFLAMLAALTEGLGIALLLPLLSTLQIDAGAQESTPAALQWLLGTLGLGTSMVGILLLIGAAFFIKALIQFGYQFYAGYLRARLIRQLQARIFDAYNRMSYRYYVRHNTGHFLNVIGAQVHAFYKTFSAYTSFLIQIIRAVTYLGVALWLAWQFGVIAIAVGAGALMLFRRLNRYVQELSRKISHESGRLNKLLVQALQGYKYLASTNQVERLRPSVMASVERLTGYRVRQQVWGGFTGVITEPISVTFVIGIVIVQVAVLELPLAPILVAILLFHRSIASLLSVQRCWQSTLNDIGSVEMVTDELEALSRNEEVDGNVELGPLRQGIEFDSVSFAYDEAAGDAIHDVSLDVRARTTVAFVGKSGAGKSTMVDLLTLLLKPTSGEIRIDGVSGKEVKLASWRSQIGYVAQDSTIFDDTVAANIAMQDVDPDTDLELVTRIQKAARRANIARFIEELPDGFLTVVGDRGIRLSGGQRQRLSIARELFKDPKVLILDEATSSLDTRSERHIQGSIDALRGELTVVVIAHRLSTIANVDQVFVLDQGRIVEHGTYDELRKHSDSRFREMVEMQAV